MNVLLHTCCAPCASHCITALQACSHTVTLYFSNANIASPEEYQKRLKSVQHLSEVLSVPLIIDAPNHIDWLEKVACGYEIAPERGARCSRCFHYSLCRTFEAMKQHGFEAFTTSLSISPHKCSKTVFAQGHACGGAHFLALDFKKQNGFQHSLELTRQLALYRQRYCGCEFSIRP